MEAIPVLYRDPRLLFVDKPTGMIIHRGYDRDPITVADIVRDKIVGAQVFALHRLDRGTSGVVGFALDSEMAAEMQGALKEIQNTEKEYVALVRGPMKEPVDLDYPVPNKAGGERVPAQTLFCRWPARAAGPWSRLILAPGVIIRSGDTSNISACPWSETQSTAKARSIVFFVRIIP